MVLLIRRSQHAERDFVHLTATIDVESECVDVRRVYALSECLHGDNILGDLRIVLDSQLKRIIVKCTERDASAVNYLVGIDRASLRTRLEQVRKGPLHVAIANLEVSRRDQRGLTCGVGCNICALNQGANSSQRHAKTS